MFQIIQCFSIEKYLQVAIKARFKNVYYCTIFLLSFFGTKCLSYQHFIIELLNYLVKMLLYILPIYRSQIHKTEYPVYVHAYVCLKSIIFVNIYYCTCSR